MTPSIGQLSKAAPPWDNALPSYRDSHAHTGRYRDNETAWTAIRLARLTVCSRCARYDSLAGGCRLFLTAKEGCEGLRE